MSTYMCTYMFTKNLSPEHCLRYLPYAEYMLRRVRGTSTATSVHAYTNAVLIVKGETGKKWTQEGVQVMNKNIEYKTDALKINEEYLNRAGSEHTRAPLRSVIDSKEVKPYS